MYKWMNGSKWMNGWMDEWLFTNYILTQKFQLLFNMLLNKSHDIYNIFK